MYELEYTPGNFITCPVLRELVLKNGTIEIMVWNPLLQCIEYIFQESRK